MSRIDDLLTQTNVVVAYDAATESGAIPVIAEVSVVDDLYEPTGATATAQVWIVPFHANNTWSMLMVADEHGGTFYDVAAAAQKHAEWLDDLDNKIVVEDVDFFIPEGVDVDSVALQARALGLALHAAGSRHGATILADSSSAEAAVLKALSFSKKGKLFYAESMYRVVDDAIMQAAGLRLHANA